MVSMDINVVQNIKDFRTILFQNMLNYDSSRDTANFNIAEWLWESKDNRVIGKDYGDQESDLELMSEGVDTVIDQISEFSDITNKKIMIYYMIMNMEEKNLSPESLYLKTNTGIEAQDNDNMEVNEFIDRVIILWANYNNNEYQDQIKNLKLILGDELVEDIRKTAPKSLENKDVGPIKKQLDARGFTSRPEWVANNLDKKLKDIKGRYRGRLSDKAEKVFEMTELVNTMTFKGDFLPKAQELKKTIQHNIEIEGGISNAEIL